MLPSATHDLTWENAWWQLHVLYILVGWSNYKSTSLENVFSRLYLIHFTELYVWICPMILIRTSVPWTSLDILFHGLCFTWYSIQMEFTWHDMQWIYLSWYSITFTGDCFPWALLLIVFNGLTWDTPQLNFIWDCLKGTWDAIQRTLLETVFNILYMRLSLVNFVGDDVQKTAIVPTLCMYLCLCVCQVSCIFLRIPDFINEDAVDFTTNVTKKLWSVARNYCAPLVCFKCTAFAFLKNVMCLHVIW